MEFDDERLLSAHAMNRTEEDTEQSLRPHTLDEYVGQDTVKENLIKKQTAVINYDFMFMMSYPDKWDENKVTAITDLESETTSFYAWNGTKLDTELFEIKVFPVSEWESGKSDDFTLITKDDKYAYTFNNINPDTQISLSDDEIKTGFSTLDQSGI